MKEQCTRNNHDILHALEERYLLLSCSNLDPRAKEWNVGQGAQKQALTYMKIWFVTSITLYMSWEMLGFSMKEKCWNCNPHLNLYPKIHSRWINYSNAKSKTIKFRRRCRRIYLWLRCKKWFLTWDNSESKTLYKGKDWENWLH